MDILENFINKYYKNPEKSLKLFKDFIKSSSSSKSSSDSPLQIKGSSSGNSIIVIKGNYAYKILAYFKPLTNVLKTNSDNEELIEYNKESLPLIFNHNDDNIIYIKKLLFSNDLNIIKYEKLDKLNINFRIELISLLQDISIALRSIHMSGYVHNDVYLENIGCRINRNNYCQYILFDFIENN